MAAPWTNLGLHHPSAGEDKIVAGVYSETRSSAGFSYARYPSTVTSSAPLIQHPPPLLSPPLPSHSGPSTPIVSPRAGFQSPNSPASPGFPLSPFYPPSPGPLQRGQFPTSPSSDGFASSPRMSGMTDPRLVRASNHMDALLETPYYDTPPNTAGAHGETNFRHADVPEPTEVPLRDGWRPKWLRRRVVAVFTGTSIMLAVVGEVVMWLLSRDDVESNIRGVWTFGPVVVISIMAMLWSRVEAQALLYTPWMILDHRPTSVDETRRKQAHRTILLDYPSLGSFQALTKGFRNRHHLVVASIAVKLLLRVQIVLSTAVFHAEILVDGTTLLRARMGILHAMVGVFLILSGILLPMLYHAPSSRGIAPRDPTSPAGTAALLASSQQFLARLTGTGNADMETVAARLAGSWYTTELRQPGRKPEKMFQLRQLSGGNGSFNTESPGGSNETMGIYRPWTQRARTQVTSVSVSIGLLAGICVIFSLRGSREGLEFSDNVFILWTCLPTLIFVAIAVFWTRIDIDRRRLAPFLKLTVAKCRFQESLGLTYMNEFGLRSAGKAIKHQDWAVFLAKSTAMLGWLMPIFTAGLFAITQIPQTAKLQLQPQTEFKSTTKSLSTAIDTAVVNQVLLQETPKYPKWTWEDVAFPEVTLADHPNQWPLPNTQLISNVPALRAALTCETLTLTGSQGSKWECVPVAGTKKQPICKGDQAYTALVASSCAQLTSKFSLNYVWGSCDSEGMISVLLCNQTIMEVDVHTTFHTEDLRIDTNAIPIINTTSQRPSDVEADITSVYGALDDVGTDDNKLEGLDSFFRTLVLSRVEMSLERLVLPERQNAVSQAIRLQHGILGAQALNSDMMRRPLSSKRARADDSIPASIDYYISRLTQSSVQTYVLAGLLAVTFIFGLLSLRTAPRGAPLPKSPGSIAAQASLLADSTLWWRLPDGAEWMSDEDLARCLRRKTFQLGWNKSGTGGRSYGIGVVQDEGKVARPAVVSDVSAGGSSGGLVAGRYISMAPGVYSYGDIPLYEKT
ncbi:hypothetical protein NCS57_01019900 [Fusarium keratoplasticum]|uniref:Uncharacterized protein n=1 Tax=Fusarium keratoplasticum TaxID=1328300 RepID=A0ACC0QPF4_9HYPO|nr:hypothetical protein NCS57_01019900 [Fusarium keratoplasticum]KAI8660426.1 hypothetical protein NCS57_01019900 [Fusarium keratoplasticum]